MTGWKVNSDNDRKGSLRIGYFDYLPLQKTNVNGI